MKTLILSACVLLCSAATASAQWSWCGRTNQGVNRVYGPQYGTAIRSGNTTYFYNQHGYQGTAIQSGNSTFWYGTHGTGTAIRSGNNTFFYGSTPRRWGW